MLSECCVCDFDPEYSYVSSMSVNRHRNSFLLCLISARYYFKCQTYLFVFLIDAQKTRPLSQAILFNCRNVNKLIQINFTDTQRVYTNFRDVFFRHCLMWPSWTGCIICAGTVKTNFRTGPVLDCCICWDRFAITLVKPWICINGVFGHQKSMFYQNIKFAFFHCELN